MNFNYILIVLILVFVFSFINEKNHIISILIILERLILIIILRLFIEFLIWDENSRLFLVILTFSVCEAALGLSILIVLIRFHRNDFLISISSIKWFA